MFVSVTTATSEQSQLSPRTLREVFELTASYGDRVALVFGDERVTYSEQWTRGLALAHSLKAAGVSQGDRVVIAMRNFPEWPLVFWSIQLLGAVAVPVNAWLTAPELQAVLSEADPVAVVADEARLSSLGPESLLDQGVSIVLGVRCPQLPDGAVDLEEFMRPHLGVSHVPPVSLEPSDIATIIFTSGTTGRPKGVIGTHWNHVVGLLGKLQRAPRPASGGPATLADVVKLVPFPFFHVAGLNTMMTAAIAGQKAVLMYKWDAREAVRLIESERVAELAGPPFVIQTLLEEAQVTDRDLGSLVSIGTGGSSTPATVIAEIHRIFNGRVSPRTGYGMTETTTGVAAIWGDDYIARPESSGRPLPSADIAILDDLGNPVSQGEVGEIAVRGAQVSPGYFRDPTSYRKADEYFRTQDLGRFDEDGFLYVVGRIKDIVVRAGENVHSAEVERHLLAHPDVLETAVLGIPHPALGEEVAAIMRLRKGSSANPQEIREFLSQRLAAFKVPTRMAFIEVEIPRTQTGKIVKATLIHDLGLQDQFAPEKIAQPEGN